MEPLTLAHLPELNSRFEKLGAPLSDYCFACTYLFRKVHAFQVVRGEGLYLKGITRAKESYIMPLQLPTSELLTLAKGVQFIYPIPEEWLPFFHGEHPMAYKDSDSDYIYSTEKLHTLSGRKLSSRRNLLHQFTQRADPHEEPLTPSNVFQAKQVLELWHQENPGDLDYDSCLEGLELMDVLHLNGTLFFNGREPIGFFFGERLSSDLYAVHFAKATRTFKGIYPYMYSHLPENTKWIDLEQDLGLAGLRQAKLSYQPDHFLKKFRIKNES